MPGTSLSVGVTGGAGSGKSTLVRLLAAKGAEVVDADRIGQELLRSNSAVFPRLLEEFGPEILDGSGEIDRSRLGAIVFADREQLRRLNALVHPPLLAELHARLARFRAHPNETRTLVIDAALLVEWGDRSLWDRLVLVTAPRSAQVARLVRDRGLSEAAAAARLDAQLPESERRRWADEVVENDGGPEALASAADALWRKWRSLAQTR